MKGPTPIRHRCILLFVIGSLLSPGILPSSNVSAAGSGSYPPPALGDWIIENDTHISNEVITIHGSLNITNNATLTLENVELSINSSPANVQEIYVDWGATLNVYNSSISALSWYYSFEVNGNMTIEKSNISRTAGGILIKYGHVVIANSTLHHNSDNALVCFGSPVITNNFIHSNYVGILTNYYSAPYIYNNAIKFNEWGIKSLAVGLATIFGNDISNNSVDGIVVELGHLRVHNNTISSNGECGIRSDHAMINATNNTIFDNGRWGIYSLGYPILQHDNLFEKDGRKNGEGDVLLEWEIDIKVFDQYNQSLEDVNLMIYNENDELVWNVTTIGNLRNLHLRDYEIVNNGTLLNHTYEVNSSWGDFYNITEFDLEGAEPSIYASKTIRLIIEVQEDIVEDEEVIVEDWAPPWFYPIILSIWAIALVFVILGLIAAGRKKRKGY